MNISIYGDNKKLSHNETHNVVHFMLSKLLTKGQMKNIELEISFDSEDSEPGQNGYIMPLQEIKYPRKFFMWIRNSGSLKTQLITIAHELTHLKQFRTGTYYSIVPTKRRYHAYYDSPQEIEAFGREYGLYVLYNESKVNANTY